MYVVFYYDGYRWREYDSYDDRGRATQVACFLRAQGNAVKVVTVV